MGKKPTNSEILERRLRLAELRRQRGVASTRDAAQRLGVSPATAWRDWVAVDALFRERAVAEVTVEMGRDLALIDDAIKAVMPQVLAGKVPAIRVLNELLARRASIYGYDAPQRHEVSGEIEHVIHELSDDAKRAIEEAERILLAAP